MNLCERSHGIRCNVSGNSRLAMHGTQKDPGFLEDGIGGLLLPVDKDCRAQSALGLTSIHVDTPRFPENWELNNHTMDQDFQTTCFLQTGLSGMFVTLVTPVFLA